MIVPILGERAKLIGYAAIRIDITDRKQMEFRLAQQAQDLLRSNEELEQFAYECRPRTREQHRTADRKHRLFVGALNPRHFDKPPIAEFKKVTGCTADNQIAGATQHADDPR